MNGRTSTASALQQIRETEGLSRAELSRASEVSDKTIKRAETGKQNIRPEKKHKIVKGLNLLSKHDPPYQFEEAFPDDPS